MIFGSVCSGIEAASVAWQPLGWKAAFFSEIEPFPSAVLKHYHPDVPNYGDMTKFKEWPDAKLDVLVGGTPCQAFSVAGLRKGLADPRGNLTLTYLAIAAKYRPAWLVWENVPGVLSDGTGAFGAFLGGLAELGYGFAYRVLDAQFFGVPQRRRRVFVVGCLGDWRSAAAVLFERESLSGDPAPRREARQGTTHDVAPCIGASGRGFERTGETRGQDPVVAVVAGTLQNSGKAAGSATQQDAESGMLIAHALRADGFDASEDGTGTGTPLVPVHVVNGNSTPETAHDLAFPLRADDGSGNRQAIAFAQNQRDEVREMEVAGALAGEPGMKQQTYIDHIETMPTLRPAASQDGPGHGARSGDSKDEYIVPVMPAVAFHNRQDPDVSGEVTHPLGAKDNGMGMGMGMQVRRLTPRECERLQGFPDNFTLIPIGKRGKPAKDGPRYKALGNSMAVPVMRWIGERIEMVSEAT